MNQLQVVSYDGQLATDSREVAEMVCKEHKELMRSIRQYVGILTSANLRSLDFFIPHYYQDAKKEQRPCFLLTRKGCDMVANKMTGEKGVLFTAEYVTKFEQMEKELTKPMSIEDMIITQAHSVKELKADVADLKKVVDNEVWLNERQKKTVQDSVSRRVFELRRKGHDAHFQTLYSSLKRFFGVSKYDKIPRKDYDEAISFIGGWYPQVKRESEQSIFFS